MKTLRTRRHEPEIPLPRKLGRYRGQTYWRHYVLVAQDWLDADLCHEDALIDVIAPSPADAANLVREEIAPRVERPTSIRCKGPRGGITERFIGWETMIGSRLFQPRPAATQLPLPLQPRTL